MTTITAYDDDRHDHAVADRSGKPASAPRPLSTGMTNAELTFIKASVARSLTSTRPTRANLRVELDLESRFACILAEASFERQAGLSHVNAERFVATARVEGGRVGFWSYGRAVGEILRGVLSDESRAELVQPVAAGWVRVFIIARDEIAILDAPIEDLHAAQAEDDFKNASVILSDAPSAWLNPARYLPADAATRWVQYEAESGLMECVTPSGIGCTLNALEANSERVLRVALWCETTDEPPTPQQIADVLGALRCCGPFRQLWHYELPNPRSTALVEARITDVVLQ